MSINQSSPKQAVLLNTCLQKIERKLGWPNSDEWRHSHFEVLSEKIFHDTHVQLSPVTLKRLWGKISYHSLPATNTLNALAQYIGYENWIAFQQENALAQKAQHKDSKIPWISSFKHLAGRPTYIALGIALLVSTTLISPPGWKALPHKKEVVFDFSPVTLGVPNTVIFSYDAQNTLADSVFIQQSWDPRLRHQVDKQGEIFTTTYYYPGFFKAKLILNDQVVSEKDLYIKSGGWIGTLSHKPVPYYLSYADIHTSGKIEISHEALEDFGFDLNGTLPFSQFHMVEDFGDIPGSNFTLLTHFRHTMGQGEAICQQSRILILCAETPFIIPFSIEGCVGELNLSLPGKRVLGQENDLSGFGVDFSDWVKLEVEVTNKVVDIRVNDQSAYQDTLSFDPGKVVGLKYQFHGTGAIQSVSLQSPGQKGFRSQF